MPDEYTMRAIAHVRSDFSSKFGIPRQSGVVPELEADVVFTPEFRNPDAFRGLERCTHIWLIWLISGNLREGWQPTVRPPRLGGNVRWGVFATRSPFRPNPIGLSCVRLKGVDLHTPEGPVLHILGARPHGRHAHPGRQALRAIYGRHTGSLKRYRQAGLGAGTQGRVQRRSCFRACRRASAPRRSPYWARTPGPRTSRTLSVSTAWALRDLTYASQFRTGC